MASWLYSLLIGLGISSGGVAFIGVFVGLSLLMIFFDERGRVRTLGIVVLIMIPILAVTSIVLLSITLNIGKN